MKQEKADKDTKPEVGSGKDRKSLLWITTAVALLVISVIAGVYWNSTMKVKQVEYSGYNFVSVDELQQIDVPTGISPDSINFVEIINKFEQIPFVRRADLNVEPGGKLSVQIMERQPVAMLVDGKDKIYVDQVGLRLPMVLGKNVNVPILYGFKAQPVGDTLKTESFKVVAQFLKELQKKRVTNATISEIVWSDSEGVVALTNQNGVKLVFGSGDFANRMRNWEAFYGEVVKQKGIESMRSVDLRFKGQIVALER